MNRVDSKSGNRRIPSKLLLQRSVAGVENQTNVSFRKWSCETLREQSSSNVAFRRQRPTPAGAGLHGTEAEQDL